MISGERRRTHHHGSACSLRHTTLQGGPRCSQLGVARRAELGRRIERSEGGVHDRLQPCAAAEVRSECGAHLGLGGNPSTGQADQAGHDPWRAEAALAGARGLERRDEPIEQRFVETVERRDLPARHASGRGDAGYAGHAVDEDRAAPALALGAAAVLDRTVAQLIAQRVEERAL